MKGEVLTWNIGTPKQKERNMLNRLKIGTKLTLGFGGMALLLIVMTSIMAYSYSQIQSSTSHMLQLFGRSAKASECLNTANWMRRNFLVYLTQHDPKLPEDFYKELTNAREIADEIRQNSTVNENRELAEKISGYFGETQNMMDIFLKQEEKVAENRANCGRISGTIGDALRQIRINVYEKHKKEAQNNSIEIAKVDLEIQLLQAQLLVFRVLSARDNFVYATSDADREKYEKLLSDTMDELEAFLETVKAHPELPAGEIATQLSGVIDNRVQWGSIAKNYVQSIKDFRNMQDPVLAKIREVIERATEMQTNISAQTAAMGEEQKNLIVLCQIISFVVAGVSLLGVRGGGDGVVVDGIGVRRYWPGGCRHENSRR